MGNIQRFDNTGTARFITFSCYHNYNLFKSNASKNIFIKHFNILRKKYSFKIYGYVIMPNHVHLVILPADKVSLSRLIGELKSITAKEILSMWKDMGIEVFDKLKVIRNGKERFAFWQRRYYDHNCRTKEITIEKVNYCHNNPVTKGLVGSPEKWLWSSYRWYQGMNDVLIRVDELE